MTTNPALDNLVAATMRQCEAALDANIARTWFIWQEDCRRSGLSDDDLLEASAVLQWRLQQSRVAAMQQMADRVLALLAQPQPTVGPEGRSAAMH